MKLHRRWVGTARFAAALFCSSIAPVLAVVQFIGRGSWFLLRALVSVLAFSLYIQTVQASGIPYQTGDVFAGVGNGQIKHFSPDGTLLDTLNTGAGGTEDTGMAFDASGNLYATAFEANNLYKFDNKGNLIGPFGSGYNQDPESIVFDKRGNAYVGQADGSGQILKFDSTGTLIDSYSPQREDRGTDWIDLAADQCTLHYTSEGSSIKQFNVCTKTQLSDFATGLSAPCYAHRIRPNSEELVACTSQVYRLNSSGGVIQTYQLPGTSLLFALNLDPDNKTFWTADIFSGAVFRIDIATGAIVNQFNAGIFQTLAGLTIAGEITAAVTSAPSATTSYYVATSNSASLRAAGCKLAQDQIATGIPQDAAVALLFGIQRVVGGQPGAGLWGSHSSLSDVASLVEAFASGYYNLPCDPALATNVSFKTMHLRIIVTTSNDSDYVTANPTTLGQEWAKMVNNVASWVISQGYSGKIDVAGGNDMEVNWNGPLTTRAWVDGYASVSPQRYLYNVGDAAGCPKAGTTTTAITCKNKYNWTQDDVWYVSWGADPAEPLPEIYQTNSAAQWAQLSLYGYLNPNRRNGGSMIMAGSLNEFQACFPDPQNLLSPPDSTCNPLFTPEYGWNQLFNALNLDVRIAQKTLPWSTDIKWMWH